MLTFRYHIASLVAVLLALAAGIALGAGVLDEDDDGTSTVTSDGKSSLADQEAASFSADFTDSIRGSLIGGHLAGTAVTMLVLPGAPKAEVDSLNAALTESGATLAATLDVGDDLVSATSKQLIDELGGQLETGATNVKVADGANTYERMGTLLGYALATQAGPGDAPDEQAQSILAGATTGGLLTTAQPVAVRGHLVLVVAGAPTGDADKAKGTAEILTSLLRALDASSGGVVLAGPAGSADTPGALSGIRADAGTSAAVSTVDNADSRPGAIVTIMALAEQGAGGAGQYGVGAGATAVRPGIAPTP